MRNRHFGASIAAIAFALLALAPLSFGQADQAAQAEKQKASDAPTANAPATKKESSTDALAALLGTKIDKEAAERGRKIFVPTCGFCHGNDAHGKSGPDLVRSTLVLHDNKGDVIGPVIRNGRMERGMPAFAQLTPEQIADISTFLHSRAADVSNRFSYKIGDVITGDAQRGAAFFNGPGTCTSCHSATSDLAHVAGKYDPVELQRRMLYPAPNLIDVFLGKATGPTVPARVTVHLANGETVSGTLDHVDEFTVTMHDAAGWYHSYSRDTAKIDVQDPRAAHESLLPKYSDETMHDVLAYLETLK